MNLDLIKELETISKETSCSLFNFSIKPKGQWRVYILSSKVNFIGTLPEVLEFTISEFKNNRVPSTKSKKELLKRPTLKYRYAGSKAVFDSEDEKYEKRLAFAKSLGYPTIIHAVGALTSHTFLCMFKKQEK